MHDFARQPVADVNHGGWLQAKLCDFAHHIHAGFRLQLTLQEVGKIFEFRLGGWRCLKHAFLAFQDLESHVGRTQIPADHQEVVVTRTIASHQGIRLGEAHGRHRQRQPRGRRRRVASHQVHLVDLARQTNAFIQLVDGLHRKPVAQPQAHDHLRGHRIHGADVAQVDHHRLVSEVLKRDIAEVKVHALAKHVGGHHKALAHGVNDRCIVPDPAKGRRLLVTQFTRHALNQPKLTQFADFRAFHGAKVLHRVTPNVARTP